MDDMPRMGNQAKRMEDNIGYVVKEMSEIIADWYGATLVMLMSIRPEDREIVIERISEGNIKTQLKKLSEKYKNTFTPPNPSYASMFEAIFTPQLTVSAKVFKEKNSTNDKGNEN